jgi:hypothetical protein
MLLERPMLIKMDLSGKYNEINATVVPIRYNDKHK